MTLQIGKPTVFGVRLWHIVLRLQQTFEIQAIAFFDASGIKPELIGGRSVVFSYESSFCPDASDGLVLVGRRRLRAANKLSPAYTRWTYTWSHGLGRNFQLQQDPPRGYPKHILQICTSVWVSAADKWCRVYPLDPHPDAVSLYSKCTPGKRRAWFCQMTGTLRTLLDSVVGGGTPG
ncbi:hypothetical protein TNCV_390711 [Trichonephila clavipes]|nr:hypothetical protein TNCV_390711 [Trichonephila clavipes]